MVWWRFFSSHRLDENYFRENQAGAFALKHFIQYFEEDRVGQAITLLTRLLGWSEKRFHFMHFMINETTGHLASTLEAMGTHVDLKMRRSAAMPFDIVKKFDAKMKVDQQLDWDAPICGVIRP